LNPLGGVGSTVEVKERPITTGGGINGPQGGSSKRSVYDRTYYVTKTKEKMMVKYWPFRECKKKLLNSRQNLSKLAKNSNSTISWKPNWRNSIMK
jgi:hypothetical protein